MTHGVRWITLVGLTVLGGIDGIAQTLPAIYPSGAQVPENLLRIEVRFAHRLRRPLSIDHVHLLDREGREIDEAFLDLPLPNADGQRVTLLLHPGRVKSGAGPNVRLGRALEAGTTVTLVVDEPESAKRLSKTWQVTSYQAAGPAPADWTLVLPLPASREPLTVQLKRPVSSTSETLIAVRGPDGARVDGVAQLREGETTWRFTPKRPWQVGRFALVTNPQLEDLAGNRSCAPFEAPLSVTYDCGRGTMTPFDIRRRSLRTGN